MTRIRSRSSRRYSSGRSTRTRLPPRPTVATRCARAARAKDATGGKEDSGPASTSAAPNRTGRSYGSSGPRYGGDGGRGTATTRASYGGGGSAAHRAGDIRTRWRRGSVGRAGPRIRRTAIAAPPSRASSTNRRYGAANALSSLGGRIGERPS